MASKKPSGKDLPPKKTRSRDKRVVFLRLPYPIFDKLQRMSAPPLPSGERGSLQATVISLIEMAKEKRAG